MTKTTDFGFSKVAEDEKARKVAGVFDSVAVDAQGAEGVPAGAQRYPDGDVQAEAGGGTAA